MVLEDAALALAAYAFAYLTLQPIPKIDFDKLKKKRTHDCLDNLASEPVVPIQDIYKCTRCGSEFVREGTNDYRRLSGEH